MGEEREGGEGRGEKAGREPHLSLLRYLPLCFQLSSGLPPLQDAVILLGIDVKWLLLHVDGGEPREGTGQGAGQHLG